ncbi:hypothetical protein IPA_06385 [Ignicoccus pacificus DSM 13166]|uniref:Uncharacterized protein n=1 Tax=Ignicoccus pacificus DSM 13166 TaxID=940294 RepID=A0A977PK79_9CREN|nr:hypothetical protein IPA_06385 [Ignicoccus pacificus DSM 13166]
MRALKEVFELIAETSEALASEGIFKNANPKVTFFSLLIAIGVVSTSPSLIPALVALLASSVLALLLYLHGDKAFIKPLAVVAGMSLVISLPLLFTARESAFAFIIRTLASTALSVVTIRSVGWRRMAKALEVLFPEGFSEVLGLLLIHASSFARSLISMVLAREARRLREMGLKEEWRGLASSVGELLNKANNKAERVSMAVKARTFGEVEVKESRSWTSLLPVMPSLIVIATGVLTIAKV